MFLWLMIAILVVAGSAAGFVYLTGRISAFGFIKKLSKDKKILKYAISAGFIVLTGGIIWLVWNGINAIICLLHLVIFWLLCDLFIFIGKKISKKKPSKCLAGFIAVPLTIVYLAVGWYLCNNVWETDYALKTDKKSGDIRIVQFADSHVGTTFHGDGFAKYMEEIQKLDPDVVLITGDFVDDDTSKEDMIQCCEALGNLKTKYGVYFSFGNHDKGYYDPSYRGYSGDDLIAELEKNNVTVLQDDTVLIDDRFYIIGRQDRSEEMEKDGHRASMEELTNDLDSSKFTVVMDHQPCDYDAQAASKVDLVLSGHTHGGQLIPINFLGTLIGGNDRTYGYEKREDTNFIVTSGISDWAIKFKTGCKSEYVVIDVSEN